MRRTCLLTAVLMGLSVTTALARTDVQPDAVPIARFQFNGDAKNQGSGKAEFELKNTSFVENALYVNGRYEGRGQPGGHRAICTTPDFKYQAFTVALRVKAADFDGAAPNPVDHTNIFTGGTSFRWFGLSRSAAGNLSVTFNNQRFVQEIKNAPLVAGKWMVIVCGFDLPTRKVVVRVNDAIVDTFTLPENFKLDVMGSEADARDRNWTFTNYSNGTVFHGWIDELIIYDRLLAADEIGRIPLRP